MSARSLGSMSQGNIAIALSCFGIMADLYDFHIVNLIRPVIEAEHGVMTPNQDAMFTGSALFGAVIGMIAFGSMADYLGRRCLFISTSALICVASIGSACAGSLPALNLSVYDILALWRFIMGLGIGGEYPLAAAVTTENAASASSTRAMSMVFGGMFLGGMLAPSFVLFLSGPCSVSGPRLWRCCFGFGALLAATVAALRWSALKETVAWEAASRSPGSIHRLPVQEASLRQKMQAQVSALMCMKWTVLGTAGVWLLYDVVAYGIGLYSTTLFQSAAGLSSARLVFVINMLVFPGFAGAIFLSPRVSMKQLEVVGLVSMSLCFALMTVLHQRVDAHGMGYLSIFTFQKCLDTLGPGMATFTIPGQVFPTRIRATAHGISAAAGKAGAVIGTVIFPYLYREAGVQAIFSFMASVCALAALWAQLFTPLYNKRTLEEIAALDPDMELSEQAARAEAILFSSGSDKAESLSLASGCKSAVKRSYGIAGWILSQD